MFNRAYPKLPIIKYDLVQVPAYLEAFQRLYLQYFCCCEYSEQDTVLQCLSQATMYAVQLLHTDQKKIRTDLVTVRQSAVMLETAPIEGN